MRQYYLLLFLILSLAACKQKQAQPTISLNKRMSTYSNYDSVRTTHLQWDAAVDFETRQIHATATWSFKNKTKTKFIRFDSYDLNVKSVKVNDRKVDFFVGTFNAEYGSGLVIPIEENDSLVSIEYTTGPKAKALQWLEPTQTAGKKRPFLFTQCESIQARSLLPCQDVPAIRITYNANVQVPKGMLALMSAKNPQHKNESGRYAFQMEIPIPSYLIALAVGDIEYKAIDARSGVYSEPIMLEKSANELSDIPRMMQAAEAICGPYRWGNYDVLIAPPSFPIGGMENPRLTFSTPTIIAGDKSLVSLIAHEMAHSWSGNLVTNATWDDIWLNEGFTTYFERRIMESISGKSYTDMLWEQGYQDMESDYAALGANNPDTRLRLDLNNRNPENAFSNIPYEKGAIFLKVLEEQIGRKKFDAYLNEYISKYAFTPITTQACLDFMEEKLADGDTSIFNNLHIKEWVFGTALPNSFVHENPTRFEVVDKVREAFENSVEMSTIQAKEWTTHEWLQFLRKLNRPQPLAKLEKLDADFNLTETGNSEIAAEWFKLSIASGYTTANPAMERFLGSVGRKKFLEPIYRELLKSADGKARAQKIFDQSQANYHPLTAIKIRQILDGK
ncbi:MAG: M1 family metallopeptidase [Bacteroidetes bacterium]|nr:M1 family metallopeptidase [Bacteroidota bacterium]